MAGHLAWERVDISRYLVRWLHWMSHDPELAQQFLADVTAPAPDMTRWAQTMLTDPVRFSNVLGNILGYAIENAMRDPGADLDWMRQVPDEWDAACCHGHDSSTPNKPESGGVVRRTIRDASERLQRTTGEG